MSWSFPIWCSYNCKLFYDHTAQYTQVGSVQVENKSQCACLLKSNKHLACASEDPIADSLSCFSLLCVMYIFSTNVKDCRIHNLSTKFLPCLIIWQHKHPFNIFVLVLIASLSAYPGDKYPVFLASRPVKFSSTRSSSHRLHQTFQMFLRLLVMTRLPAQFSSRALYLDLWPSS